MATVIPKGKVFYRVTNHRKPRYQLFQPGFNESNSCWLHGDWINLPQDEWEARKDQHQALYGDMSKKDQHHRNPGTNPEDMTEAQRQAWEHYSGESLLYYQDENGHVGMMRFAMSGCKMRPKDADALREQNIKIVRRAKEGDQELDYGEIYGVPEDLLTDADAETKDPWDDIVDQNRKQEDQMFEAYLESDQPFMHEMACHAVTEVEKGIIRSEWMEATGQQEAHAMSEEKALERYRWYRQKLTERFGATAEPLLERVRSSENECARSNLDSSNGVLFSFVLPKFEPDGSHEPWGERDVPWNRTPAAEAARAAASEEEG